MADIFTLENFSEYANTEFRMHHGQSQTSDLKLESVNDLNSTPRQIQFSLVFLGPLDAPIYQGVYRVDHEKLGPLDLFLVPISKDKDGVRYEAVFNRFVE
jgi:hypothetical protein